MEVDAVLARVARNSTMVPPGKALTSLSRIQTTFESFATTSKAQPAGCPVVAKAGPKRDTRRDRKRAKRTVERSVGASRASSSSSRDSARTARGIVVKAAPVAKPIAKPSMSRGRQVETTPTCGARVRPTRPSMSRARQLQLAARASGSDRDWSVGSAWAELAEVPIPPPKFGAAIWPTNDSIPLDARLQREHRMETPQGVPTATPTKVEASIAKEEESSSDGDDEETDLAIAAALRGTALAFSSGAMKSKLRAEKAAAAAVSKDKTARRMQKAARKYEARSAKKESAASSSAGRR